MTNDILVVAGMHRSGTSLMAQWLHACGLQLGDRLVGAGMGNVEGHFEDLEFLHLHETILRAGGADAAGLHGPYAITPSHEEREQMQAMIEHKNARYRQWGWKEPRTSLFLDTYAQLLPGARYLVVLRDFQEVTHSLLKRDLLYLDEKYRSRGPLVALAWRTVYRPLRVRQHQRKYYNRYLRAWIAYNRAILDTLQTLPEQRYLVVSYQMMRRQCAQVFEVLTLRWRFQLRYTSFASIYRGELISPTGASAPGAACPHLLAEAELLAERLRQYLQRSAMRLERHG